MLSPSASIGRELAPSCATRPPYRTAAFMLATLKTLPPSRYVIYVGFLAIFAAFCVILRNDGFASPTNLLNIVQQTTPVSIMAVGAVFVLTAGEIDLSIGSIVAVSALLAAMVLRAWPWPIGVAVGLVAGAAIG